MSIRLLATAALFFSTAASAQEGPLEAARAEEGIVTFQESFRDPGDETAKSLAAFERVSLEEARRRLRVMFKANRLSARLEQAFPDTFGGVEIKSGLELGVEIRLKGRDAETVLAQVRPFIDDPELEAAAKVGPVRYARKELLALGRSVHAQLKSKGVEVHVAVEPSSGRLRILTKEPSFVQGVINSGQLLAFGFREAVPAAVEYFGGIEKTASLYGGVAFNGNSIECTTGFTVMRTADRIKGITTAGHCNGTSNFNEYPNTNFYSPGGIDLRIREVWTTNNLDILMASSKISGDTHVPYFLGSIYQNVTGGLQDTTGTYVCKKGRTTGITCGYIDGGDYLNSPYGYFRRVNSNPTYPKMNEVGDSGGPVYSGSLAVGTVHAKDASGNMYFGPLWRWSAGGATFGVVCSPCG